MSSDEFSEFYGLVDNLSHDANFDTSEILLDDFIDLVASIATPLKITVPPFVDAYSHLQAAKAANFMRYIISKPELTVNDFREFVLRSIQLGIYNLNDWSNLAPKSFDIDKFIAVLKTNFFPPEGLDERELPFSLNDGERLLYIGDAEWLLGNQDVKEFQEGLNDDPAKYAILSLLPNSFKRLYPHGKLYVTDQRVVDFHQKDNKPFVNQLLFADDVAFYAYSDVILVTLQGQMIALKIDGDLQELARLIGKITSHKINQNAFNLPVNLYENNLLIDTQAWQKNYLPRVIKTFEKQAKEIGEVHVDQHDETVFARVLVDDDAKVKFDTLVQSGDIEKWVKEVIFLRLSTAFELQFWGQHLELQVLENRENIGQVPIFELIAQHSILNIA